MNRITFPLKLQMKRPEVAHLQAGLAFLGFSIAKSDKTNQRFGASTRKAVMQFQTETEIESVRCNRRGDRHRHQRSPR